VILIRKVKDDFGWMGNMSPFPVDFESQVFRTTEALFQSLRFQDQQVIEAIREQKSPMAAKMIAKKHKTKMTIVPMSEQDVENMRMVLDLKLDQHPELKQQLLDTGDQSIIEDCSKRPRGSGLFWGAALKDGEWVGENWLGRIWCEIRQKLA